jgi:hypothetical protein
MNRLLTKRDKHGSHRRSKSSEPGSKVTSPPRPLPHSSSTSDVKRFFLRKSPSSYLKSISAAFPNANGKCLLDVETTAVSSYATNTDSRHGFTVQPRPLSGHNILSLLKPPDRRFDADKKQEKEDAKKV